MNKLQSYLTTHKIPVGKLAKQLGISQSYLSGIKTGARRPSLDLAFAIEDVTEGHVTARSWSQQIQSQTPSAVQHIIADSEKSIIEGVT